MRCLLLLTATVLLTAGEAVPPGGIGFRYDGSGVFPNAKPPVQGRERWKAETANWGYGCPVEIGGQVLLMCEGGTADLVWPTLFSIDATTGTEQWRCPIDPLKAASLPDAQAAKLTAEWAYFHELIRFIYQTAAPFPGADEAGRARIQAALAEKQIDLPGYKPGYGLLRQMRNNNVRFNEAQKLLKPYGPVWTTWQGFGAARIGSCFPTPVSDGEAVYVLTLFGSLARVGLNGKMSWIVDTSYRQVQHNGLAASPRVWGDLVLAYTGGLASAFDRKTGRLVWKAGAISRYKHGDITSSVVLTLGTTPVWLTPRGEVYRLPDGKLLTDKAGLPNYQSWAVDDAKDVVYHSTGGDNVKGDFIGNRLKLEGEAVTVENLFTIAGGLGHTSATFFGGKIYHSGRIYDGGTGALAAGDPKRAGAGPQSKHLVLIADGRVYGLDDNQDPGWGAKGDKRQGRLMVFDLVGKRLGQTVFDPPADAEPAARMVAVQGITLGEFSYACAFTLGRDCVYVRSPTHLWCLGN